MSRLEKIFLAKSILLMFSVCTLWGQSLSQPGNLHKVNSQKLNLRLSQVDWLPRQINLVSQNSLIQNTPDSKSWQKRSNNSEVYLDSLITSEIPNLDQLTNEIGANPNAYRFHNLNELDPSGSNGIQFDELNSQEIQHFRTIPIQLDSVDFKNFKIDSVDIDRIAEQQLLRLEPIQNLPPQPQTQLPTMPAGEIQSNIGNTSLDHFKPSEQLLQQATDYFKGRESELQDAQDLMSKLKKKYRSVPNSNDLSTAIKCNSLEGEPFASRIVPGLNFQILQWDPFSVDLSPNLMYRINTELDVGIAGNLRASFDYDQIANNPIAEHVYGGSLLARHLIFRDFFLYTEAVWLSTKSQNTSTDNGITRSWQPGLLLGIGKRIHFSDRLKGQVIFTFDVLHEDNSPTPRAWNIKFGIQTERLFQGSNKIKDLKN